MRASLLAFLLTLLFLPAFAQNDETVFVVKAKPAVLDTAARRHEVEIYWQWKAPMHNGQVQSSITGNFKGTIVSRFTYRDSGTIDTTYHNYESIDVHIANKLKPADYHSNDNRITPEITSALNKMMLGTTVTFKLNRTALCGESKTETLTYHIISFARFMGKKRKNWYRINRGLPPNL